MGIQVEEAIQRVEEFLEARKKMKGMHPHIIYGIGPDNDLLVPDLRVLVAAAKRHQKSEEEHY